MSACRPWLLLVMPVPEHAEPAGGGESDHATAMEMISDSVCLSSMLCYALESHLRNETTDQGGGSPSDATAHMARHRTGARGNATSFPLPWEDILAKLKDADTDAESHRAPDLPWVGTDLCDLVSVVLKTSEEDNPGAWQSLCTKRVCAETSW